jgi:hypothetical protein
MSYNVHTVKAATIRAKAQEVHNIGISNLQQKTCSENWSATI